MNAEGSFGSDSHAPLEINRLIDSVCDIFEGDLRAGLKPDIEFAMLRIPPQYRLRLVNELVLVFSDLSSELLSSSQRNGPPHLNDSTLRDRRGSGARVEHIEAQDASTNSSTFGPFELLEEIGRGGMGVVYRARQLNADRIVAVKIINAEKLALRKDERRADALERFRIEAKAAARLNHQHIVAVYDIGTIDGRPYYSMQYVEGQSLAALVQKAPLSNRRAALYIKAVAQAVDSLHLANVLHRDLKPSNILIDGRTDRPLVADFGLAKLTDTGMELTLSRDAFGSPPYMAPEQVRDVTKVTRAADIYSLGATLYHLIVGRPPFQAATPPEVADQVLQVEPLAPTRINPMVHRDLETICLKCLEKEPTRRYATAGALAEDLSRFLEGRPIDARPTGFVSRTWRWCLRHKAVASMIAVCAVTLTLSSVVSAGLYLRERASAQAAQRALDESRARLSREYLHNAQFTEGTNPLKGLPWLIESLRLNQNTPRETLDRQRIASVLRYSPAAEQVFVHHSPLNAVAFSSDGKRILTSSSDGEVQIWSATDYDCLAKFSHGAATYGAQLSHDGKTALTYGIDGCTKLFSAESEAELHTAMLHTQPVLQSQFDASDRRVFTRSKAQWYSMFDAATGELICRKESDKQATLMAVAPAGDKIACATEDGRVTVFSSESGKELWASIPSGDLISTLCFSSNGNTVLSGDTSGRSHLYDATSGEATHTWTFPSAIKFACFCSDSGQVIVSTADSTAVWDITSGSRKGPAMQHNGLESGCISHDGETLLTLEAGESVAKLWEVASGTSLGHPIPFTGRATAVAFSPDDKRVLIATSEGTARVWNWDHRVRGTQLGHKGSINSVRASANGERLATSGKDGWTIVFDSKTQQVVARLNAKVNVRDVCLNSTGTQIGLAGVNGSAFWADLTRDPPLLEQLADASMVTHVTFCGSGQYLAVGTRQGQLKVWDIAAKSFVAQAQHKSAIVGLAALDDRVLSVSADEVKLHALGGKSSAMDAIAFTTPQGALGGRFVEPDGLAVFGFGGFLEARDLISGSLRMSLRANSAIEHLAVSPDRSLLLTSCLDGTCRIWSTVEGEPKSRELRHHARSTGGAFSPDGKLTVTCSHDRSIRVWKAPDGEPATCPILHARPVIYARFLSDEQLLTVTDQGEICHVPLEPEQRSCDELAEMLRDIGSQNGIEETALSASQL